MPAKHMADLYEHDGFKGLVFYIEAQLLDEKQRPVFRPFIPIRNDGYKKQCRWSAIAKKDRKPGLDRHEDAWTLFGYLKKYGPVSELVGAFKSITLNNRPHITYWMPQAFTGEQYPAICFMRPGPGSRTHAQYCEEACRLISPVAYN